MDPLKISSGCHTAQTACQLEVILSEETSASLDDIPCTLQKNGLQCGATTLPYIYIPGAEKRTLTIFRGKDSVAGAVIHLPAKTEAETVALQRAILSRVQRPVSDHYAQLYAFALAAVGEPNKALDVLNNLPENWPQISLNNIVMKLIEGNLFQAAAQLTPLLIPEKVPTANPQLPDEWADRAKLMIANVALTQKNEAPFRKLFQETQRIADLSVKCRRLLDMTDVVVDMKNPVLVADVMRSLLEVFEKSDKDSQNGDSLLRVAMLLERQGRLEEAQVMVDRISTTEVTLFYKKFELSFRLAAAREQKDDQKKLMNALLAQPLDVDKVHALLDLIKVHQADAATLRSVITKGLKKNEPSPNHRNMMVHVLWPAGFHAEARQVAQSVKDCHYPDFAFQEHYEVAALRALAQFSGNFEDAKSLLLRIQKIKDAKEREGQLSASVELLAPHDHTGARALAEKLSGDNKGRAMLGIAVRTHDFLLAQRGADVFFKNNGTAGSELEGMLTHGMQAEALLIIDTLADPKSKALALINGALSLRSYKHWLSQ